MSIILVIVAIIPLIAGYPNFRARIPNGHRVPNPCRVPDTWNPVGHYNPVHHTTIKNPFGLGGLIPCQQRMCYKPNGRHQIYRPLTSPCDYRQKFLLLMAFRNNNFTWNEALCKMDSDKDGMTNGEELGDSSCKWRPGLPAPALPIGHPGICEPVGSTLCHYQHFKCDCLENCHGLTGHQ